VLPTATETEDRSGFDGSIDSAVELMLSPELKGETVEAEEVEEEEETPVEAPQETETEPEEDDDEEYDYDSDADSSADQEDPAESPKLYTVKVDGKEEQVSLDDLKRGYSGQQYVQHGMKEVAEARKQAEGVYNSLVQERQQIAQFVENVRAGGFTPPPKEPDKNTFDSDPIGYMNAKIEYDESKEAYELQLGRLQQVASRQTEADQAAMRAYLQGELRSLQAIEPDFADADKAGKVKDAMIKTGIDVYGYAPEEIQQIVDHRAIRVLRDAMRYQEIKNGKVNAEAKTKKKMAHATAKKRRPTTAQSNRRKQQAKLRSSGNIDDALGLLMQ